MSAQLTKLDKLEQAMSGHEIQVNGLSGSQDSNMPQFSPNHINRGLFGGSYSDLSRGQDCVITLSVPREPPVSLGAFQHAIANGVTARMDGKALKMASVSKPEVSHAVSNSYAVPVLLPSETESSTYQDHSYHVNRMLWDSWFLSGIVQQQSPHHVRKRTAKQVYADFIGDPKESLPNNHMRSVKNDPATTVDTLFTSGGEAKADAYEIASSKLLVEGAFNVNSTSVAAWKAVLASADKAAVPVADDMNSPASVKACHASGVPVNSLLTSYGGAADPGDFKASDVSSAANPAQWRGCRKLDYATEIEPLAEAIVREIRKRGPFLSLADFINRRPSNDKKEAMCGPLQTALDGTVNSGLFGSAARIAAAPADAGFAFPEAAQLPKSMNSPCHMRQADILTAIGSRLTVRSDTFRIRTYGEARDTSGKITGTAWCEATVQRTPDYLDPVDPAHAADPLPSDPEPRSVPALASSVNKRFGRRLEITSFRWLTAAELES